MAYNIDLLVLLPVYYFLSFLIQSGIVLFVFMILVSFVYDVILTVSVWQGTLGKRLAKIKVVSQSGGVLTLAQGAARTFIKLVSIPILPIAYLVLIFSQQARALHDMIIGSQVIISDDT